ncbi:Desmoglein-1, partial [Eschrichtius robustus]|nr:Desmoglein-1 [Eschrichtius robustus]
MQDLGGGEKMTALELVDGVKTSGAPKICQEYSGTLRRSSMRECTEEGLNMNFMESYFCQKAYAYADEDEARPPNDCLLIYDIEGVGSPAGSVGCCSFIGEDLDDSFLDTLGPKFKNTYPSGPGVQHPIPDPLGYGNVTLTESYTTLGTLKPSVHVHDNQHASNVVVTEKVVGPISGANLHGMLEMPDLRDGSNVIVTERVITPGSSLPSTLTIPDPRESSNVVVTERVVRPNSGLVGNLSVHSDFSNTHNVIVTEKVVSGSSITGISGPAGLGGGSGIGSSGLVGNGGGIGLSSLGGGGGLRSSTGGTSTIGHLRGSSEHHFSNTLGSVSPITAQSRITKYGTGQYAK